jgi:mannitol 2-dehydrogenase
VSGSVARQPLNSRTLPCWRGRVPVPGYDRDLVTQGVVHVGVGGFHRAHQAMYHDRMMNEGAGLDWGICGVGVLAADRKMQQALALLLGYMDREATPTQLPVPGVDLAGYKQTLLERFANPQIRDTIARLCAQSSDRIPKFVLPVIRQQLATGGEIKRSAAVVASWARYAEGIDERGEPIDVVDRHRDRLTRLARRQREDPGAFIANRDLFGDLADDERFVTAYRTALASLHQRGARATVESLA